MIQESIRGLSLRAEPPDEMESCMRKIVLFDPSITSLNMGDHIIVEAARRQLAGVLSGSFEVSVSTHMPVSWNLRRVADADLRFVLGSNILAGRLNRPNRSWDIRLSRAPYISPVVLMGVGWRQYGGSNVYTRALYRQVLSRKYLHSVRDEHTRRKLARIGVTNVLNTACPTMWELTPDRCAAIPLGKAPEAVVTLSDYNRSPVRDRDLLVLLTHLYDTVHLWVQGYSDLDYARELAVGLSNLDYIAPTLSALDSVLSRDVDYVGTRLHGGIRALQRGRRTIIIGIDNRALEIHRDFGIPCVRRDNLELLPHMLCSEWSTEIDLPMDSIARWKNQFEGAATDSAPASHRAFLTVINSAELRFRAVKRAMVNRAEVGLTDDDSNLAG